MIYRRKRRSAWFTVTGVVSALALGVPATASATTECTRPEPPARPVVGANVSANPPGETAVQSCSPFPLRQIGRRH